MTDVYLGGSGANASDTGSVSGIGSCKVMPPHSTGSFILAAFMHDSNSGGSWSTPTGYTNIRNATGGACNGSLWYKVATSSSEAIPTSVTSATGEEVRAYCMVWEGIDNADPINTSALQGLSSSAAHSATAMSTDENDTINCYFYMADSDPWITPAADYMMVDPPTTNDNNHMLAFWQVQESSGTSPVPTMELGKAQQGLMIQVALNTDTSPQMPARVKVGSPPTEVLHPLAYGDTAGNYNTGTFNPATAHSLSTINSIAFNYDEPGSPEQQGGHPPPLSYHRSTLFEFPSSSSAEEHWGYGFGCTEVDGDGRPVIIHIVPHALSNIASMAGVSDGGIVIGLWSDRGGTVGCKFFKVNGLDGSPNVVLLQGAVFDSADAGGFAIDTFGTYDNAKQDGVFLGILKEGSLTAVRMRASNCRFLNTMVLVGGNATRPCNFQTAIDALKASSCMSISNQSGGSSSQFLSRHSIQIGDGAIRTRFSADSTAWEFAPLSNDADKRINHSVSAASLSFTLYGSASCVFDLDNVITSGPSGWKYTVHASHDAGATVTTSGHKVVGADVTLQSTWSPTGAGVFDQCGEIIHNGATLTTPYVISGSTDTNAYVIAAATQEALQTAIGKLANTDFSSNTTALRLEFTDTSTGTTNVTLTGPSELDFDGNAVDLHYNASKTSQLTFTPGAGSDTPSTAFSGSATGVTIDNSTPTTLSAPNLIDDTRYQIYNVTQATELYNAVVSGGSGLSISTTIGSGLSVEVGDTLRLRATYQSAAAYKLPSESSIIANTSSNVWTATQSDWTVMESYGLDGSDYDYIVSSGTGPFNADFTNDEPDYELTSNFAGSWFVTWLGYIITTSDGIDQWFGGFTLIDAANLMLDEAIIPGLFDNQTTAEVYQTDTIRIFRGDGVRPVRNPSTGGGGIDINWKNQVYLQTTGSGALTTEQVTSLTTAAAQATAANTKSSDNNRLLKNRQDTNPDTGKMTVYADDDTTPLYEADLSEDVGGTGWTGTNPIFRRDRLVAP